MPLQTYFSIVTFIFVGIGILLDRSRFSDIEMTLNKRFDDLHDCMSSQSAWMLERLARIESDLKRL